MHRTVQAAPDAGRPPRRPGRRRRRSTQSSGPARGARPRPRPGPRRMSTRPSARPSTESVASPFLPISLPTRNSVLLRTGGTGRDWVNSKETAAASLIGRETRTGNQSAAVFFFTLINNQNLDWCCEFDHVQHEGLWKLGMKNAVTHSGTRRGF